MPNISHNQEKAILQKQLDAALDKLDEADAMDIKKMDPRFVAPEPEQLDPAKLSIDELEDMLQEMDSADELTVEYINVLQEMEEGGKNRRGALDLLEDYRDVLTS